MLSEYASTYCPLVRTSSWPKTPGHASVPAAPVKVHIGRLQVAIKFLPRGPCVNKAVMREVLNHRMLAKHPHVVRFMEVILTPYHLGICMEYCPGGDLFEYLASHQSPLQCVGLPEDVARRFFQQLITAVDFTHELGIANRLSRSL